MPETGAVVWIDFPGAVVTKRRPAVVVSTSSYHSTRPDLILGLITGQVAKSASPSDAVLTDWQTAGLRVPSAFRVFLVTLPRSAVISEIGRLTDADWQAVQKCLRSAVAFE